MSRYKYIRPDGFVTEEDFELIEDTPTIVTLLGSNNAKHRVTRDKLIPSDTEHRTIAIELDGELHATCPNCHELIGVSNTDHQYYIMCDCTVGEIPVSLAGLGPIKTKTQPKREKMSTVSEENDVLDLEMVKAHGVELWSKPVHFDHANVRAISYTLLADDPARKVCFITYDGSIGKKAKNTLDFTKFKANEKANDKQIGYYLKNGLDAERELLTKRGYTKC